MPVYKLHLEVTIFFMGAIMNPKPKAWISWSSGKDAAWALNAVRSEGIYEITRLLTTITETYKRVSMHSIREELLDIQSAAIGIPLYKTYIPSPCSNEQYAEIMTKAIETAKAENVTHMIFGDLFLEDVRQYREEKLAGTGITPIFPLWGINTRELAESMIQGGAKAVITCIDPAKTPRELAGKYFDNEFLKHLPHDVDPCGENGEFHSFAFDGPAFSKEVNIQVGETVQRGDFVFTDVLPVNI